MPMPAARVGDLHVCPEHGNATPIVGPGAANVIVGGQLAARMGDIAICKGSIPDTIVGGNATVQIARKPAARMMDKLAHGGFIPFGCPSVLIGDPTDANSKVPPECSFLNHLGRGNLPQNGTGGTLARLRDGYTFIGDPKIVSTSPDGEGPDTQYEQRTVDIRGHQINVYTPVGGAPAGTWLPNSDQMAGSLATLSDQQLANIQNVYAVPHPSQRSSNAVAWNSGSTVAYFTRGSAKSQADLDWVFQHESGHAWSLNGPWQDPSERTAWDQAMAADGRGVSDYGNTNDKEDFAEFMLLYAMVVGTGCEAAARAMFPNRFKQMDRLGPTGMKQRQPIPPGAKF